MNDDWRLRAPCELIVRLDEQEQWSADVDFKRWHPIAQEWEDPDEPLPKDDAAKTAEHEAMLAEERRQTKESGHPEFEVGIDLPSRHEAERFAERLRAEGLPTVRRWRYVLVGANDEDSAKALAGRLREEAPAGAQVSAEGPGRPLMPSARRTRLPYSAASAGNHAYPTLTPPEGGESRIRVDGSPPVRGYAAAVIIGTLAPRGALIFS